MSEEQARGFLDQATQSIQNGMFMQAIDLIDQAIALDPTNSEAYLLRGVSLANSSQPDAATEAFNKSIELQPNNPKAHFNLAVHLSHLGNKQGALDAARAAVQADPAHAGARELVNQLERELGVAPSSGQGDLPPVQGQAANPYANPQPSAPYYREGYAPSGHTLKWVENMGPTWTTIGWIIAIVGVTLFVLGMFSSVTDTMEVLRNPEMARNRDPFSQMVGWKLILSLLQLALQVTGLLWVIFDIIDRRGNWLWLVLHILCCCCIGPGMVIYMAAGRKQQ